MSSLKRTTVVVLATAAVGGASFQASATAPLTKAQARSIAKHINVHQSDFPGYTAHPYERTKEGDAIAKKTAKCTGSAPMFVSQNSAAYDDGNGSAFSSVTEFVYSRAAARHDAKISSTAHARHCGERAIEQAAKDGGASDADVTLTPVSRDAVKGLDAMNGLKITMKFSALGFHTTLHGWAISFTRGNAEVTITEIGTADRPISVLDAPLTKIIGRAKHRVPVKGLPVQR